MDGNGWKWMEMDGNGWKWMEMDGNGWKWMEMDGNVVYPQHIMRETWLYIDHGILRDTDTTDTRPLNRPAHVQNVSKTYTSFGLIDLLIIIPIYPVVIKRGNEKSIVCRWFGPARNLYRGFPASHVWLPRGTTRVSSFEFWLEHNKSEGKWRCLAGKNLKKWWIFQQTMFGLPETYQFHSISHGH